MSGDLQGSLGIGIGDADAQLGKVEKGFKKIATAAREARRDAVDYQAQAARFFRGMQTHAEGAEHSMHSLRHSIRFAGEQLELSGITGGRGISGALALEGTFGRVAAGVAVAGVAMKAYDAVLEANAERFELARKAAEAYEQAVKSGHAEMEKQAKAGLGQTNDIRQLVALGGGDAIKEADALAADPRNGISGSQARRGVAHGYLLKPDIRGEAYHAAIAANSTGLTSFEGAMDEIVRSPQLQGVLRAGVTAYNRGDENSTVSLGQSRNLVLSTILSGATGTHLSSGDAGQIYNNLGRRGAGERFLGQSDQAQAVLNGVDTVDRKRVEDGLAVGGARGELAAAMNPVAQALVKLAVAQQKLADVLLDKVMNESFTASIAGGMSAKGNAYTQYLRHLDASGGPIGLGE